MKENILDWIGKDENLGKQMKLTKEKVKKIEDEIDYDKAYKIFSFIENYMTLPDNKPFKILPYHKAILTILYCTPYDVSEFVAIVGRSNAKSIIDVMIVLIEIFLFPKPNSVIALMAKRKSQAEKILLKHFKAMGNSPKTVVHRFKNSFKLNKEQIIVKPGSPLKSRGTEVTIYANNEGDLDGGREKLVIVDEFGAFTTNPLITIRQGLRKNKGKLVITTTNNTVRGGAYDDELENWKTWASDEDFSRWCFYYALDSYDEVKDKKKWVKSNPALGYTVSVDDISSDYIGAIGNAVKMSKIITKRFNLSMADSTSIFSSKDVENCLVPEINLDGKLIAIGSDFSVKGDVWGTVVGYKENGNYYLKAIPIMPEYAKDKFKHLGETLTHTGENNMSDEAWEVFTEALGDVDIVSLNYDRAYATNFIKRFEETFDIESYNVVMQNSFKLNNTIRATQKLMASGHIKFDSKLLGVHLMNAQTKVNDFDMVRIIKKGYADKIDLADAMINLMWWFLESEEAELYYE